MPDMIPGADRADAAHAEQHVAARTEPQVKVFDGEHAAAVAAEGSVGHVAPHPLPDARHQHRLPHLEIGGGHAGREPRRRRRPALPTTACRSKSLRPPGFAPFASTARRPRPAGAATGSPAFALPRTAAHTAPTRPASAGSSVTATRQRMFKSGVPPAAAALRAASPRNISQWSTSAGLAAVTVPTRPTSQPTAAASSVKMGTSRPATATRRVG